MNAIPSLTEEQRSLQELVDSLQRSLDRLEARESFLAAERAYKARNEAWRASPEGIAYREKCFRQDAEVAALFDRIIGEPKRSPAEIERRIADVGMSWMDGEKQP